MSSDAVTRPGLFVVLSAPSGTGKTTVAERLVEGCEGVVRSRSFTSRAPRPGEQDGVDYNFVSRAGFEAMVGRGGFLEWADVFGNLYGTGRQQTEALIATGQDVLLVIDVQGARQVRASMSGLVTVFVLPPSFDALEARLRGRSKDGGAAAAEIEARLRTARQEVEAVDQYDYVIVNDDLERCVGDLTAIIRAERLRRARRSGDIEPIRTTFRSTRP